MSIVLLPIMRSKDDKITRIRNCIELSKKVEDTAELLQIQAMLYLMAEKFVSETDLEKVKEVISMVPIMEMITNDAIKDDRIDIARKALAKGLSIGDVADLTGFDESVIRRIQTENTDE